MHMTAIAEPIRKAKDVLGTARRYKRFAAALQTSLGSAADSEQQRRQSLLTSAVAPWKVTDGRRDSRTVSVRVESGGLGSGHRHFRLPLPPPHQKP
ncbi:hypothetical protein PIB30_038785 [Stylosanthes scabra]|uniref:Uncharacterized protein n=1 Tax=Stylosanthes scabra TaxID=79078 RepID=A0ABU6YEU3_9FABA|nr:hypothetical protein [Stylosanthes scabra]